MEILIILIVGGLGLLLIILGNYYKISSNRFKNNGIKTQFKVIETTKDQQVDIDDNVIGEIHTTTFEFSYNGKILTEKIQTHKSFTIGEELTGIYLPRAKLNKIMVAGEGFQMASKVEWILIIFGLFLICLVAAMLLINTKFLFPILISIIVSVPTISIITISVLSKK